MSVCLNKTEKPALPVLGHKTKVAALGTDGVWGQVEMSVGCRIFEAGGLETLGFVNFRGSSMHGKWGSPLPRWVPLEGSRVPWAAAGEGGAEAGGGGEGRES